jgi:hypothetical protein
METEEYGLAKVLKPHIDDDQLLEADSLEGAGSLADFDCDRRSVRHLAVVVDPVQRQEIAEALVSELELRYPDRDDQ